MSAATPYDTHAMIAGTNAGLMAAVQRLYDLTGALDLTYGRGMFWRTARPAGLVTNDARTPADHAYDFTALPAEWADTFPAVVFDPPYVATGRLDRSTIADMTDRYGMTQPHRSPAALWESTIAPGIREAARVAAPGALVLVKCMDYVSSGRLHVVTADVFALAAAIGLVVVDYFILSASTGPQPSVNVDGTRRTQRHARHSGLSFLLIFRKGGRHGR